MIYHFYTVQNTDAAFCNLSLILIIYVFVMHTILFPHTPETCGRPIHSGAISHSTFCQLVYKSLDHHILLTKIRDTKITGIFSITILTLKTI